MPHMRPKVEPIMVVVWRVRRVLSGGWPIPGVILDDSTAQVIAQVHLCICKCA